MRVFAESGLSFSFDRRWIVKKYDDHHYYRGLAGAGLKGVDFVGIRESRELVLLEVKNYSSRYNTGLARRFEVPVKPIDDLAHTMERKIHDTLLAIDAIRQHYERSWHYRFSLPLLRRWPWPAYDRAFWTRAYELAQYADTLRAVLWLELDDDDPADYLAAIRPQLSDRLSAAEVRVEVASRHQHPFFGELQVNLP